MSLEPRDQVLRDMLNVTDIDLGQAMAILDYIDSIGYRSPQEPDYAEASMTAIAESIATFYLSLRARSVPETVAAQLAEAFMTNAQGK